EPPTWGQPAPDAPAANQATGDGVEHDGNTVAGGYSADHFARQHPGIPGQPQAPSVTAQPVARLVFSSGETIDVDRAVLVGRAPEARRFTSTDQPRLVTVPSPNQEISSTHLEVRPGSGVDHGSAIVTDMGSTNGTVLTQPGFAPEDLQPGIAVQLLPGSVIDLGDGVTIQVTSL
ncbi:FHA domain-containing protein, partial [Nocardioides jensenii]|uniref:FHA domain-containing protein n=1 Tax=Nocardioides jensenii TaxID=1843 RepID=UPI000ACA551F